LVSNTRRSIACTSGAKLGELVEAERAAVGLLNEALLIDRAGERPLPRAEQDRPGDGLLEVRAALDDQRRLGARAELVERAGDALLPAAGLAADEERHVVLRGPRGGGECASGAG